MSSPADPARTPAVLFTARMSPDGGLAFDIPAAEADTALDAAPDDLARELTSRLPSPRDGDPGFWESVRRMVEDQATWRREFSVRGRRTGRPVRVRVHAVPRREPDGSTAWVGLLLDVTHLREAEEAVGRSESRLRAALTSARMLGWDWDLAANRAHYWGDYAAFFGLPAGPDYTALEDAWQALHPDDVPAVEAAARRAVETGEELAFEARGRVPGPDGRPRWFATRGQVLRDADGRPTRVVAVTTEVTDRKRAEEEREALDRQLLEAQKWESLGVLAGGVAHDFNNILTVVLGCAGLARKVLPPDSPAAGYFDQIERASRRAADLCRQMLAYAGRGPAPAGQTDLNELIRETAPLLQIPTARSARVRFELAPGLPPLQADAAQVRQVLVNLVMNAGEAVGDVGGDVVIRTGGAEVREDEPAGDYRLPPAPGRYVCLEVADTGPGVGPEVQARMFDPFFTTKFPGRGLGLAAVLGMVRTHGGGIRIDSAPGRGTTVRVLWPPAGQVRTPTITPPPPRPVPPTPAGTPGLAAPRRGDVALVVDDEMYVREVAASTLEEMGYTAVLAGDGPAGVELFRQHRGAVRVAVIDVVMPGMAGDKVLEAIRRDDPTLPVVLISGYTDRRPTRPAPAARTEFLQKPFHPEDLAAAVQRVVGAPAV